MMSRAICAGFLIMLAVPITQAQIGDDRKCNGPIYGASEVTRRARILGRPDYGIVMRSLEPGARAHLVLNVVLCRTGQVTDIKIVKGMSAEVNESAVTAVKLVRFVPAELRWHSVSTRMSFELRIGGNPPGIRDDTSTDAGGRLVETTQVIGNRRLTAEQILSWIKTRPGEPYSDEQIKRDFDAILATRNFDKTQTSFTTEDGVRGGVIVTFEVVELPSLVEINFEGLRLDRSVVFEAWRKEHVDLRPGVLYNVEAIKAAERILKQLLDANGQGDSRVQVLTEQLTATSVNIIFVITPNQ